jgi:hypothetical protein
MLTLLLACAERDCREGFDLGDDGLCYEDADADSDDTGTEGSATDDTADSDGTADGGSTSDPYISKEELLALLPPCEPADGPVNIDIAAGCAGGACLDMTYAEVTGVLGDPAECDWNGCTWDIGLVLEFESEEDQPLAEDPVTSVDVEDEFDGATEDGLGPGASLSCFLEALGEVSSIFVLGRDGGLVIWSLNFSDPMDVAVFDDEALIGSPDGLANNFYMEWP